MSNLARIVAVVLIALAGCATPPSPVPTPAAATPPPVCNICRWVYANGILHFSKCGLPVGTVLEGWERSDVGQCSYEQRLMPKVELR
jgi:hypothetical protein